MKGGGSGAANFCALGVLGLMLLGSVPTLMGELGIVRLRSALAAQAAGLDYDRSDVEAGPAAENASGRAALLRGMLRAREKAAHPERARPLLAAAERDIAIARAARPVWGEADVAAAYVALLSEGAASPRALAALTRSYRAAPFLRDSAPWRIRFAIAIWPHLDHPTRRRVVAETAWLARASGRTYRFATGLVAGTPAAAPVAAILAHDPG